MHRVMALLNRPLRPLLWIGSSRKDYLEFPAQVQDGFGFELHLAQSGLRPPSALSDRRARLSFRIAPATSISRSSAAREVRQRIMAGRKKQASSQSCPNTRPARICQLAAYRCAARRLLKLLMALRPGSDAPEQI